MRTERILLLACLACLCVVCSGKASVETDLTGGAGGTSSSSGEACNACVEASCPAEVDDCQNDAGCLGSSCSCCAAYLTDEGCTYAELDADSAAIMDVLSICACLDQCSVECADMCT